MNATTRKSPKDHGAPTSNATGSAESITRGPGRKSMAECPMAGMCQGMMQSRACSGWLMLLPGALLMMAGLVIILVPEVLAWLLGGAAILMGALFMVMASLMRRAFDRSEPGPT